MEVSCQLRVHVSIVPACAVVVLLLLVVIQRSKRMKQIQQFVIVVCCCCCVAYETKIKFLSGTASLGRLSGIFVGAKLWNLTKTDRKIRRTPKTHNFAKEKNHLQTHVAHNNTTTLLPLPYLLCSWCLLQRLVCCCWIMWFLFFEKMLFYRV